jgi:hypothetical protein
MRYRILAPVLCAALLTACSKPEPPAPPAKPVAAQPPAVSPSKGGEITKENQGILTDTEAKGMNQANQVGNVLKDADEARKKQMKEQGI